VEIELYILDPPLDIGHFFKEFGEKFNEKSSQVIITKNGSVFQGFMASMPSEACSYLLDLIGDDTLTKKIERLA